MRRRPRMEPTQEELYRPFERFAEEVTETIRKGMNRLQLAGFDELNVIQATRVTKTLYERVDRLNRKRYRELCEWVYEWVYVQYGENPPDEDWTKVVDDWLRGYDPVTGYVYERELEAKRLKFVEDILTARETSDRNKLIDVVRTAANLLLTQSLQSGLDIMGEAERDAFREANGLPPEMGGRDGHGSGDQEVERGDAERGRTPEESPEDEALLQYHACNDSRTCGECKADDGKVFTIYEAPRIPRHYRCRCWYTRVK